MNRRFGIDDPPSVTRNDIASLFGLLAVIFLLAIVFVAITSVQ